MLIGKNIQNVYVYNNKVQVSDTLLSEYIKQIASEQCLEIYKLIKFEDSENYKVHIDLKSCLTKLLV